MWNLKNNNNKKEQTKAKRNRFIDTGNKLVVTWEGRSWGLGKIGEGDEGLQTSSYEINVIGI